MRLNIRIFVTSTAKTLGRIAGDFIQARRRAAASNREVGREFQAYCEAHNIPLLCDDWRDWIYMDNFTHSELDKAQQDTAATRNARRVWRAFCN